MAPNAKEMKTFVNAHMFMHISRKFGNAWEPQDITPIPVVAPRPKDDQIAKTVAEAKRPLILLGSRAKLPPVKVTFKNDG